MEAKTFWKNLFLLLLALGTWWAAERMRPPEAPAAKKPSGRIDYYSRNIRRKVMDETGRPKELLLAESLTHYPDEARTELTKPVFTLYGKHGDSPWEFHSETATLPDHGDMIYLNGDVVILRSEDKKGRNLRILTSNARVRPDQNYAETDEFVLMLSPPERISGTGAKVNFGEDVNIKILSQVRRKHEVQ